MQLDQLNSVNDIYLIGAGGHAAVVLDNLGSRTDPCPTIKGVFIDPQYESKLEIPVLGPVCGAIDYISDDISFIIAIGSNIERIRIAGLMPKALFYTAIHRTAVIGTGVTIGQGTVIMPGAIVNAGAVIGDHVIINSGAVVEHNCVIGDYAHISPGATICGEVKVGRASWVCTGAIIVPKVKICANVIIGAGATVINDILEEGTYVGCPAVRVLKRG